MPSHEPYRPGQKGGKVYVHNQRLLVWVSQSAIRSLALSITWHCLRRFCPLFDSYTPWKSWNGAAYTCMNEDGFLMQGKV